MKRWEYDTNNITGFRGHLDVVSATMSKLDMVVSLVNEYDNIGEVTRLIELNIEGLTDELTWFESKESYEMCAYIKDYLEDIKIKLKL